MKILFAGDSFTYGDELIEPEKNRFTKLVCDHFNAAEINRSRKSAGNDEIFLQCIEGLIEKPDVCVIQLSDLVRITIAGKEISSFKTLKPRSENKDLETKIAKYLFQPSVNNMSAWYRLTKYKLVLVDDFLRSNNIKMVYCPRRDLDFYLNDDSLSLDIKRNFLDTEIRKIILNNKMPGGHPNEIGHELIAKEIIKKISG